jgi:hypothetical protein
VARVQVRGGPHDGAEVAKSGHFRWLDERGGHSKPGPGRTLYHFAEGGYFGGQRYEKRYEYVGAHARFCPPCNAVVGRRKTDPVVKCPMCGSPTQPTHQPKEE